MAPPTAKKSWSDIPAPKTMQQKMAYLVACQEWFGDLELSQTTADKLGLRIVPSTTPLEVPNWYHADAQQMTLGDAYRIQCAYCARELPARDAFAAALCPYARLFLLRCGACATPS